MSVINSQPLIGASGQGGGYNLTNSLRFRSSASAFLNRTPASQGSTTTFTWSAWVKRGTLGSFQHLFACPNNNTSFRFTDTNLLTGYFVYGNDGFFNTTAVYRDTSAWYHIVLSIDTTQANSADRIKVYVNGVLQTLNAGTTSIPTQNYSTAYNRAVLHTMGQAGSSEYFDGYMAEVNFVDGQQLTPASFGETDTATGVWKPKKYAGTYGTNGFYLPFRASSTSSHAASFNGSSQFLYLGGQNNFAFGSGDFTVEMWINPTSTSSGVLYDSRPTSTNGIYPMMYFDTNVLYYYVNGNNEITVSGIRTGVWTHIALVKNSGSTRIYVNGVQAGNTYTDGNTYLNGADRPMIGRAGFVSTAFFNGFISNLRVVKGTAVYTSTFTPPSAPLTAIANTELLTLQGSTIVDNSTNGFTITNSGSVTTSVQYPFTSNIAGDASGNNNNWTPNNISLVNGATYDSMKDVPTLTDADTANYAVLNPLQIVSINSGSNVFSDGNLRVANSGSGQSFGSSTISVSSGKFYAEMLMNSNTSDGLAGAWKTPITTASLYYQLADSVYYYTGGAIYYGGSTTGTTYSSYTTGDIIGIALDMDNGKIYFSKNGVWQGSSNPATGTNPAYSGLTGSYQFGAGQGGSGGSNIFNFGQRPFAYTPPSGFKALNTFNLPTPTIGATASTQANKYMDATLFTSSGNSQAIVNAGGFQPDLIWQKSRGGPFGTTGHILNDTVRGLAFTLSTNGTGAEGNNPNFVTAVNANGWTQNGNGIYFSGDPIVGWQWRASGSTVSNTSGSITSTVSANTSAGFSIVTFNSGSAGNKTVGHGLGVKPAMMIFKDRVNSGTSWQVWHQSLSNQAQSYLNLHNSNAAATDSRIWANTAPTSTVFSFESGYGFLTNSNIVAYCFAEVDGYSKFGIFTGNGSTDNVFTYTGFRPKFVMIKATTGTDNWFTLDSTRNPSNVANSWLSPNLTNAEGADPFFDFLSNGFKMRLAGNTPYIYAAFAETPFKYSLAR